MDFKIIMEKMIKHEVSLMGHLHKSFFGKGRSSVAYDDL